MALTSVDLGVQYVTHYSPSVRTSFSLTFFPERNKTASLRVEMKLKGKRRNGVTLIFGLKNKSAGPQTVD
jgi:hypothetical protein